MRRSKTCRALGAALAVGLLAATAAVAAPPKANPANCRNTGSFEGWLAEFRKEALAEGVTEKTIRAALGGMAFAPDIIARDRRQTFFAQTFLDFSTKLATANRLASGKRATEKHQAAFDRAEQQYGIPAAVIAAFWALESDFGIGMGNLPILRSLATLAYDCRRPELFRPELMAALKIIDKGDLSVAEMIGSWAGEIGQTQFLPTHYLNHAVDADGSGRPDLMGSAPDIIASSAKYIEHLGWRRGEAWLEEVRVPAELPWDQADLAIEHQRGKWSDWGVTKADGSALPKDAMPGSLLLPMGRFGPAFLAYHNFRHVYLQWNESLNYATTAAYLATRIEGAPPMRRGNRDVAALSFEQAKELQTLLARQGHDVGKIDGTIGAGTRRAVKAMQQKFGMPADSYPTPELLAALRGGGGGERPRAAPASETSAIAPEAKPAAAKPKRKTAKRQEPATPQPFGLPW